jgi:hypothetical protein
MKPPSHTPEQIHAATRAQYQRLAEAMMMIREAVETCMGSAAGLPASEQFPTAYEEWEAIAHAIARFAAKVSAKPEAQGGQSRTSIVPDRVRAAFAGRPI